MQLSEKNVKLNFAVFFLLGLRVCRAANVLSVFRDPVGVWEALKRFQNR